MNKAEKTVLSLGLLLWFGGDLLTTYLGLNMGFREMNLPTQDFSIIFLMKLLGAVVVVSILLWFDAIKQHKLKIIPYATMILVGGLVTVTNYMKIIGMI